jgi:UDP-N-acetylenolpyruvoylglucosamine reductase
MHALSVDDVAAAHGVGRVRSGAAVVLGGGTNLVIADAGVAGLVVAVHRAVSP